MVREQPGSGYGRSLANDPVQDPALHAGPRSAAGRQDLMKDSRPTPARPRLSGS